MSEELRKRLAQAIHDSRIMFDDDSVHPSAFFYADAVLPIIHEHAAAERAAAVAAFRECAAQLVETYITQQGDHLASYGAPSPDADVLAEAIRKLPADDSALREMVERAAHIAAAQARHEMNQTIGTQLCQDANAKSTLQMIDDALREAVERAVAERDAEWRDALMGDKKSVGPWSELPSLRKELAEQRRTIELLREVLSALVDKMERVGEEIAPIFTVAAIHGTKYTGPNVEAEMAAAQKALADTAPDAVKEEGEREP